MVFPRSKFDTILDDSDSGSGSAKTSSEAATSSEDEGAVPKTPRKRARPWRGAVTPKKTPKTPSRTPSKRGNAATMFEQKSAPERCVLPDFITQLGC